MAVVGTDGNNVTDNLTASDIAINSRARTAYDRDPFQRQFGIGLRQAIGNPTIAPTEIQRRLDSSLGDSDFELTGIAVELSNGVYVLDVELS